MNSFMDVFNILDRDALKSMLYKMVVNYKTYQEEKETQDILIAWWCELFDKTKLKNISVNHLTNVTFKSANRCYTLEMVGKKPHLSWTANKKSKYRRTTDKHGDITFNNNRDCYHWLLSRYKR